MTSKTLVATGFLTAAGFLTTIAACSASGSVDPGPDASTPEEDGGSGPPDVVTDNDASPVKDAAPDAERPLVCGDAGFCETRVPISDLGLPLSLRGVWAVGPNDAWSVTIEGYVLHYDGTSWRTEYRANHELYAVWATSNNVWVGGENGLLFRRDTGGNWSRVEPGHVAPIRSIYGSSDDDVWFASRENSIDHFDGTSIQNYPLDAPGLLLTTVFGRPGVGTYAAGYVPKATATDKDRTYVYTLSTSGITPFNPSLQGYAGLLPFSAIVTQSPDENQRIYLTGDYAFTINFFGTLSTTHFVKYWAIGPTSTATPKNLHTWTSGSSEDPGTGFQPLAYGPSDLRITWKRGVMLRWDGSAFTELTLAMGYDFVPKTVRATDSNSADAWIVGDGFALKGAMP